MHRVYLDYFGLEKAPFAITPDPAFVYLSPHHQDGLAHLLYGVGQGGGGGFVQLTGEVGTGKTTLCRCLLEQIPAATRVALILNPLLSPTELVTAICDELEIDTSDLGDSLKGLVDRLNHYLLKAHAAGERVVVIIDEAQNLSRDSLEQVRLLTNLETATDKLLQIILLGQPELRDLLEQENLRQLAQRITARFHLTPLNEFETGAYINHRMAVAGARHNPFDASAMKALYSNSGGVPRLINIIADRALVAAYAKDSPEIDSALIHAAADEVRGKRSGWLAQGWLAWAALTAVLVVLAWTLGGRKPGDRMEPERVAAIVPVQSQVTSEPQIQMEPEPVAPVFPDLSAARLANFNAAVPGQLASMWDAGLSADLLGPDCGASYSAGFSCLQFQGNWQRIRNLGLPAVLALTGAGERAVLLQGLTDEFALLAGPQGPETVPLKDLESHWLGQYKIIWPQAQDWPRQLKSGNQGPAVTIVQQLAVSAEQPFQGAISDRFSSEFKDWVIRFQQSHGLDDDGIIGPATLLYLLAPSIESPRLKSAWSIPGGEA